jgi:hypothetical protein
MSVQLSQENDGKVLVVHVKDRLTRQDYAHFVPEVDRLIGRHGKIQMLFEMHDFHGWSVGALWEDTKFALRHFRDIERLAIVGDKKWQAGMAVFCKPFTKAEVRYFEHSQADQAKAWLMAEPALTK